MFTLLMLTLFSATWIGGSAAFPQPQLSSITCTSYDPQNDPIVPQDCYNAVIQLPILTHNKDVTLISKGELPAFGFLIVPTVLVSDTCAIIPSITNDKVQVESIVLTDTVVPILTVCNSGGGGFYTFAQYGGQVTLSITGRNTALDAAAANKWATYPNADIVKNLTAKHREPVFTVDGGRKSGSPGDVRGPVG